MHPKTISNAALVCALSLPGASETLPTLTGDDAELEISGCLITPIARESLAYTDQLVVDQDSCGERNATWDFTLGSRTNIFPKSRKVSPNLFQEEMKTADAGSATNLNENNQSKPDGLPDEQWRIV